MQDNNLETNSEKDIAEDESFIGSGDSARFSDLIGTLGREKVEFRERIASRDAEIEQRRVYNR